MQAGYASLSEKEKEALRLIVRGHDAKSAARERNLSVHTVNERFRDARRKLSVSSSRETARIVLAAKDSTPESVGDKPLGMPLPAPIYKPAGAGRKAVWPG